MNIGYYVVTALAALGIVGFFYKDNDMNKTCMQQQTTRNSASGVHAGLLKTSADLSSLFPQSVTEIQERTQAALSDAKERLAAIIAIPAEQRTYQNTMYAFDQLCGFSSVAIAHSLAELTSMVYPEEAMRDAGREASKQISAFYVDEITNNKTLYEAIKSYANTTQESLSDEQRFYITETIADFKRGGLDLPDDKRAIVAGLQKELSDLSIAFEMNISADNKSVAVSQEQLAGLDADFIASLKKTDDGLYLLTTDYPTFFQVMENCTVEDTRKQLFRAFENRAYPANESVLKTMIAKRDQLAHELGFKSFAHLSLDDQMVKNPEKAESFLHELVQRSSIKEQQEFEKLTAVLPESVTLTAEGKLKPWDIYYVSAQYKKKNFNLDERVIAEYFPMEKTVQQLFRIYEEFMGLSFVIKPGQNLWHEDVQVIEAYDATTKKLLGYILLDLYPRANKYTHACHGNVIPAVTLADGSQPYVASLVIANFPKSTTTKPSLLKRSDVTTFFHEFGHALHGLLGRTKTASFSGTRVKTDFVELPSQMLEEWMMEKDVLKQVSSHYLTGEPLSDELINKIVGLKHFDTGAFLQRQGYLAFISLEYYKAGADKDLATIIRDLSLRIRPNVAYDDTTHKYASFGHLTGYGPKYYGYMWSKVYAMDLFEVIREHGFSPEIGKKYVTEILSKGGSKDPMDLLVAFLGREPQQDAFFKDLGL